MLWAVNKCGGDSPQKYSMYTRLRLFQSPNFKFSLSQSIKLSFPLAMALSAAFKERLDQMEFTRNQRLHLLQAEKELQVNKSQILASKQASIQSIERRCLMLHQKIAAQNLKITVLRSTIEDLDSKHNGSIQQLRTLKSEVEELKELDEERDKYYKLKCSEMNEFMQNVDKFRSEKRLHVVNLRIRIKELSSTFEEIHERNNYLHNTN